MHIRTLFQAGAAALLVTAAARGDVIENFDYSTGALGTRTATGTGLTGSWGGSISGGVVGGSAVGSIVDYGFTAPSGYGHAAGANSYRSTAGGNSLVKLSDAIDLSSTQTKYMSFYINLGTVSNTGSSFAGVYLGTDTGDFNQFGFIKGSSNTTFGVQTSSGLTTTGAPALAGDTDYFVVMKLDTNYLGGSQDRLQAKIYTSGDTVGASDPVWDITSVSGTNSDSLLTNLALRNGSAQSSFRADNVIIGDTWEAVTVPEPGTLVLVGLSLGVLALFRRRT